MPPNAPLLPPDDVWLTLAWVTACVAVSMWLEQTRPWAARVSGPVLVLLLGLASTNAGLVAPDSPVFAAINRFAVPICVPLLLLRANLRLLLRHAGSLFGVFHLAALGTIAGGFAAHFILRSRVADTPEIAGIMTGSYIGGSVNFTSLARTYGERMDTSVLGPLVVADNLVMAGAFFVCFALPGLRFLRRRYPAPFEQEREERVRSGTETTLASASYWRPKPISLLHIATALSLAIGIAAIAETIGAQAKASDLPQTLVLLLNPFLVSAALCVCLATFAAGPMERLSGTQELGTWLIYLFFFAIGTEASVARMLEQGSDMFQLCAIMALANIATALLLGRLFRCKLEEIALAINASLGGPPSAAAMAIAKGWPALVLPAILVGVWGYIIGNACGIAVAEALFAIDG